MPRPRRPLLKRKPRVAPTKRMRKQILSVLKSQAEMKYAYRQFSSTLTAGINANSGIYQLEPTIPQGDGTSQRTGNSIRLHKCVVTGYINWKPNLFNSEHGASQASLNNSNIVKLMVLKQRSSNSGYAVVNNSGVFEFNNLLEDSQPYTGSLLNILQDVNRDAFIVKKKIDLSLTGTVINNGAGSILSVDGTEGMWKKFSYTMRFGKAGKKIDFRTSGQTNPNNFPYFLTQTSQNTYDGTTSTTMFSDVTSKWYYTDI